MVGFKEALRRNLIQHLLISIYHMTECNDRVKEYSARNGIRYEYKMRLRTDLLFLAPIPLPHRLDFGITSSPTIYTGNPAYGKRLYEKFAFGRASAMDTYMGRYPALHTFSWYPWNETGPNGWSTEDFLDRYLREMINASILYHNAILFAVVRERGYVHPESRDERAKSRAEKSR
jgi:hypothetical protein